MDRFTEKITVRSADPWSGSEKTTEVIVTNDRADLGDDHTVRYSFFCFFACSEKIMYRDDDDMMTDAEIADWVRDCEGMGDAWVER